MKRAPLGNRRYTKRVPFLSKIVKSRVPSGCQASVLAITGLVAPPRLKNKTLFFYYFRCQALKMKTLIYIRDWKKETELRVCLYVRAVTRTQITRDSADQDIVHMKETRSEKKRVDLFMRA